MTKEAQKLLEVISRIIELRANAIRISPEWIANEVMKELDPENISPVLVKLAANLEIRQLTRGQLRKRFEDDEDIGQDALFPELQSRYPSARSKASEEPEYILREHMEDRDVKYNVARLEREAVAKQRHADALKAWWQNRRAAA